MTAPIRPTSKRPDGHMFNCCMDPNVWRFSDDSFQCRTCGHDWTDSLAD